MFVSEAGECECGGGERRRGGEEEEQQQQQQMEGNVDKEDNEGWGMRLMSLICSASSHRSRLCTPLHLRLAWAMHTGMHTAISCTPLRLVLLTRCPRTLLLGPPFTVSSSLSPSLYVHVSV